MGELIDKAKGKLKEAEGKITGDKVRESQGKYDQAKGALKGEFERVKQAIKGPPDER